MQDTITPNGVIITSLVSAGFNNTTGCSNNFIGILQDTVTPLDNNNFLGCRAGLSNTTGSCNNMIGVGAGRCATVTGSHNNFLGTYAGKCASGSGRYNNFIGLCAGYCNTTGSIITSLVIMQDTLTPLECKIFGMCRYCNFTGFNNNFLVLLQVSCFWFG